MSDGTINNIGGLFASFADYADEVDERLPFSSVKSILDTRRRVGRDAAWGELIRARAETKRNEANAAESSRREAELHARYEQRLLDASQRATGAPPINISLDGLAPEVQARLTALRQQDFIGFIAALGQARIDAEAGSQ